MKFAVDIMKFTEEEINRFREEKVREIPQRREILLRILDRVLNRNFRGSNENIGRALLWMQISHDFSRGTPLNLSLARLWNERKGEYRKYLQNWNGEKIGFLMVE
jgi:hypothetical protein